MTASAAPISVVIPSLLSADAGGRSRLDVTTTAGASTVGGVLDAIAADYPKLNRRIRDETGVLRRYVNLYVDGEDVRRLQNSATMISSGQEILIIQSVAGG